MNTDLLLKATPEMRGATLASKNIKRALKAEWPSVKFSVRVEYASMMSAVRVHWTDGPTDKQVEAITNLFTDGDFDGMDDSYKYRNDSAAFRGTFGGAKYITTHREASESAKLAAIKAISEKFGVAPITLQEYDAGAYWTKVAGDRDWSQLMRDHHEKRFAFDPLADAVPEPVPAPEPVIEDQPEQVLPENVVVMADWLAENRPAKVA
jgi:hypothetical protein